MKLQFILITLFCSSIHGTNYCPYSPNGSKATTVLISEYLKQYPSAVCYVKDYDHSIFNEKILDYQKKLKPFFTKIQSKKVLSAKEAEVSTKLVNEYYTYLVDKNIVYGELARDVVNDHGAFARLANSHLQHRAGVKEKSDQIENIKNNIRVSLAYKDAKLRSKCTEFVPYEAIAKYHYEVFENQGLSKYAWGGTLLEEFAGSGSWMNIGGYDKSIDFKPMNLIKALIFNKEVNGVKAREALNSIKHIPLEKFGDSLLASTYRILITYEPIYDELKKHHNSFYASDGHMYNFEEYKTEVLDKMFEEYKTEGPDKMFAPDENQKIPESLKNENNRENDDTESDDAEDFSNSESNVTIVKVVNLGSTRVYNHIIKRLSNGGVVVMWCIHKNLDYSDRKAYVQIHSKEGNKLKGPIEIPLVHAYLEPLSDGNFIIYTPHIYHIYNANIDLIMDGRFMCCSVSWLCFSDKYVTAMADNKFLLTWHERTETKSVTFKGQYYNIRENETSEEFIIYHGTESAFCKLSNIRDDFVGIMCKDGFERKGDEINIDEAVDFLACVNNVPQRVNCYTTMSTVSNEKKSWIPLPPSSTHDSLEILNLGHHNFVILIEQLKMDEAQRYTSGIMVSSMKEINVIIINNHNILSTIKIESQLNQSKKYTILPAQFTNEFLITCTDNDGYIESSKYNVKGEFMDKEISITLAMKGSNHHFEMHADKFGIVVGWLNSKHKSKEIQEWHHFEYGYSGAWSNFEELNTSIFMLIKNNNSSIGFIDYMKNLWYSLY